MGLFSYASQEMLAQMSKIEKKRPQNSLFFAVEILQNISGSNRGLSKPRGEN